jgi:hypothetical protein
MMGEGWGEARRGGLEDWKKEMGRISGWVRYLWVNC